MKPQAQPPFAAEVSWAQVHAYRLSRHHLIDRAPKQDLTRVVGDISGAQAQVMSAAEMQIGVRAECTPADVRDALWKKKSLVKTWLMRGTLHLVPASDLPVFTAAMSARWMRATNAWLKWVQMSEAELYTVIDAIGEAMDDQALTREELIARVGKGRPARIHEALKSGWGGLLKPVARQGLLCFGPSRGQSVTFVNPRKWLPAWRELDPGDALTEMARRYLRTYGPGTKHDFARWWGSWQGVGKAAWAGLEQELVQVSIEGRPAEMLAGELGRLAAQEATSSVQLLPAFDPYLMGHSTREHLFEKQYSPRVSRVAGWISPVVLIDGRVEGTWTQQVKKKDLLINIEAFTKIPVRLKPRLRERAARIGEALGYPSANVKVTF